VFFFREEVDAPNVSEQFYEFMLCVRFVLSFNVVSPLSLFRFSRYWEDKPYVRFKQRLRYIVMPFARRRGVADRRVIALLTLADNLEEAARSRLLVICPSAIPLGPGPNDPYACPQP